MKYNVRGLNKLSKQFNLFVKRAGFDENNVPLRIALIHSEISEVFEAFRNDMYANIKVFGEDWDCRYSPKIAVEPNSDEEIQYFKDCFEDSIKNTLEDELADSVIRLLDLCGKLDVDIEWHIQQKMRYNETRGFKYGGKKF